MKASLKNLTTGILVLAALPLSSLNIENILKIMDA